MSKRSSPSPTRTKIFAALSGAFILFNLILVTPVFASTSGQQASENPELCIPIIFPCPTPTPTQTRTPTPTPTHISTPTLIPGLTRTPTPGSTGTPLPTPTSAAVPQLSSSSSYILGATQIVGINGRLDQSDPLYPVLIFDSTTIQGLKITHLSFTLGASGTVTTTRTAIKTSLFQQTATALASFVNKADLITLSLGGTVPRLVMTNVHLQVDRYIDLQSITLPGLAHPAPGSSS